MRRHQHDNDCDTHIIQNSGLNQEADYQTYYVGCVYTGEGTSISCRQEKLGSPRRIDTRLFRIAIDMVNSRLEDKVVD